MKRFSILDLIIAVILSSLLAATTFGMFVAKNYERIYLEEIRFSDERIRENRREWANEIDILQCELELHQKPK